MLLPRDLVIFGTGSFGELARAYFEHEGGRRVVAYSAHRSQIAQTEKDGLPVVAFEDLHHAFPPGTNEVFVAVGYTKVNAVRSEVCAQAKELGYALASFVSPRAHVWPGTPIGENVFIFEDNTIQPFVRIGDGVVLWSGNHIGHHSILEDHCFLTSHVVVCGHATIGARTFIGVNAVVRDSTRVGARNIIGAGALIMRDTKDDEVYIAQRTKPDPRSSAEVGL